MGVIKLIMNEIIMVDHLIRLDSAFGDKKWLENSDWLSRLPNSDVTIFYDYVKTTMSHVHDLRNPQEVLDYFGKHFLEYPNLNIRTLERILNY